MTVYVFHNPLRETIDYLETRLADYPAGTTVGAKVPSTATAPYLQVAWDGSPGGTQQVETGAVRVTAWAPKGQSTLAADVASLARKHALEMATATIWRTTPGAGRLPDVDPDSGLPFCSFTVNADVRPVTP